MVGWRSVTRVLGFVSTLVMARLLMPSDFGLVAIATSLVAAIEAMSELGLRDALVRHPENDRKLFDTAFTMQLVRAVASALVIGSGAWVAAAWFEDARLVPLVLIMAGVAFVGGLDNIAIVGFQRDLRFDIQFRLLLVPRLLQFTLTLAAAVMWRNYWALMLGVVVGRVARTVMTYVVVPYRPGVTFDRWRDLIGFSFWSWFSSILGVALVRSESFILGPALGPTNLGIYFVALEMGLLPLSEVIAPAATALFAGFALAGNRGTDTIRLSPGVMGLLIIAVAPFAIGISATAGYMVAGLLGPKWEIGRDVIALAGLMCIIAPVPYIAVMILTATGNVHRAVYAKLGAVVNKIGLLLLLPANPTPTTVAGAVGFALFGEAFMFCWQLRRCGRLEWKPAAWGVCRSLAACSAVAGLLWVTGLGWTPVDMPPARALLIGMPIGGVAVLIASGLHYALWWAAGRPDGPEASLVRLLRELLPKLLGKFGLA